MKGETMEEFLTKIQELYNILKTEIEISKNKKEKCDSLSKELKKEKDNYTSKLLELESREARISQFENIIKIQEQNKVISKELEQRERNLVEKEKIFEKKNNECSIKIKEAEDKVETFRRKINSVNETKVQLEKDKENMREQILEELRNKI